MVGDARDKAIQALKAVEWTEFPGGFRCPYCKCRLCEGHADGCLIAEALEANE